MFSLLLAITAWAGPSDDAIEALVEGRDGQAVKVLEAALKDDEDGQLRCLLGQVALQTGRPAEALKVLEALPETAECAGRGAFIEAEALRELERVDEAAERYGALTRTLMEPEVQPLSQQLEDWAERLVEDGSPTMAAQLLHAAGTLEKEPKRRLELGRRIAGLSPSGSARQFAVQTLSEAVGESDLPSDRRLLAPLLGGGPGLALLSSLPEDAETLAVRLTLAPDLAARHQVAARLMAKHGGSDEAREARLQVGLELASAGWVKEARALLEGLEEGAADWALADLSVRTGSTDARKRLEALLKRYPTASFRASAEAALDALALDGLRRAPEFRAADWDAIASSASLALEAAWASDDPAARLDELIARWPRAPEAATALDHRALTEGLDWLRGHSSPQASRVLAELEQPEIGVRTTGTGEAEVEVSVRGVAQLDMRLHRIDLEGWLRAGGVPGSLGELDVAIVAPDLTWTVPVPEGPLVQDMVVSVPVKKPGLYAVTAATTDREARTLLVVGDTKLLARAQGADVALVAFSNGKPVPRARFLVRSGGDLEEVRADGTGLAMARIGSMGQAVVVADTPSGPALLQVGAAFPPETQPIRTAVDLDRPVYRPGDVVRFRALATRAGEPMKGPWRVSLVGGSVTHQEVRVLADRAGTVHGEVVLPWLPLARYADGSGEQSYALQALPPGYDAPIDLASIRVVDEVPLDHDLRFLPGEGSLEIEVRDGQGVPVEGVPLVLDEDLLTTDARGRVALTPPPEGLPWSVTVSIAGSVGSRTYIRPVPSPAPMELRLVDPRANPREPVSIGVEGKGEALVRVRRWQPAAGRPAPLARPASFTPPPLKVFEPLTAAGPRGEFVQVTEHQETVDLGSGTVTLPGMDAGWYTVELVRPDGSEGARSALLEVREGLRLRLDDTPVVGDAAEVRVDGGWALVTVEGGRMLDATLVPPGAKRDLVVDRRWHGAVTVVASSTTDMHSREVEVDAALRVGLEAAIEKGRWKVSGRVTDGAGNPQRAQVVVRALDVKLLEEVGEPRTLSPSLLAIPVSWSSEAAVSLGLSHGGWAVPLAAELMAEATRAAEARRARLAREGRLSESRVADVLSSNVPIGVGYGGLGTRGTGMGGGGGYGQGGGISSRGKSGVAVGRRGLALRGVREVGLWKIIETDASGRWSLDEVAPSDRVTWRVEAIAVAPGSLGRAQVDVEPPAEPWLAVDPLLPGWEGDAARPRVRIVNPGPTTSVQLSVDGGTHPSRSVPSGAVVTERLALDAGQTATLELGQQRMTVSFPLWRPARIEGPAGTLPARLGLEADPAAFSDMGRAAVAGRAAIAVWPALDGEDHHRAEAIIRGALGAVRTQRASRPQQAAQAMLFVAEAAQLLELPREVVDQAASMLEVEPQTPRDRLDLAWARAVAGLDPVEATIGRLQRDRERLEPEGQALLNRLLHRLGRDPGPVVSQPGAQAHLAAVESGSRNPPPPEASLPLVGDARRPDWLRASLPTLRTATSVAAVADLPESGARLTATRWPAGFDGRRARGPVQPPTSEDLCGTEADAPCRLERGESLVLNRGYRAEWPGSAGLEWSIDRGTLTARVEGTYVLHGFGTPLHIEVGEAGSELGQAAILASAQLRQTIGEPTQELLSSRPSLEDWRPALRGTAAQLRFADADPADAAAWIAAFEDLKDQVPNTPIELASVVDTADAYHATGRHDRAIQVYERAIGQLFLEEAGVASQIEGVVGTLATIQALRQTANRYPAVPLVEQAIFALPDRLLSLVGAIPIEAAEKGVTDTELRLMAAAWDRDFVALSPRSPHTPEAGLRLATGLLELGADERALGWAQRLLKRYPDHPLVDRWLLLEALISTELGDNKRAETVLQRLATTELPLGGGRLGPSSLRDDARFALGRLAEVERRWDDAGTWYRQVQSTFPEAALASTALARVSLSAERPLVRNPLWESTEVVLSATNVSDVEIRAYAVDLRTLFLRESGIPRPEDVAIDGLRPALNLTRSVEAGPFPVERTVPLPLEGPGAWLVRFDTNSASAAVWVLRSDLELDAVDSNSARRLVARYLSQPAADVEIRALGSSGIIAEQTDVRGVALLGQGSGALAQLGPHYALTRDAEPQPIVVSQGRPAARPSNPSLLDRVKSREVERRQKNRSRNDFIGNEAAPMPASAL